MIRKTKGLIAVEDFIKSSFTPVSSADIIKYLEKAEVSIDRATIFRTISRLLKAERIYEVNLGDGKKRFEMKGEHHHHLVCTKCGSITAIHVCDAESMAISQARKAGFQIHSHSLEYFGLCSKCIENNKATN